MSESILIVEDESHIGRALKLNLEMENYVVTIAADARSAAQAMLNTKFSIILLDVELPDMTGFDFCRQIRKAQNFVPIIMLTVRSSAQDKVEGLEAGADDYLPKPFSLEELLARIRSLLRRKVWEQDKAQSDKIVFANVEIDISQRSLSINNEPVELTSLEFELLLYFARNQNKAIGRSELLENVWKLKDYPNTRTVDNFVSRLRRHIENDPQKPQLLRSVRGFGYQLKTT